VVNTSERHAGQPDRDTVRYVLRVLRRRWPVMVIAIVACWAVAIVFKLSQSASYDATSRVLYGTSSLSDAALQVDRSSPDPERDAATNVLLARSQAVAQNVRQRLHLSESVPDLLDQISAEAEENANVVRITAADPDPRHAAALANAFAQEFIAFRAQGDVQSIEAAETDLRNQLSALPANAGERQGLEQSLERLTSLRALANGDARIISVAEPPAAPSNPGLAQLLVLATIIGIALGGAAIFLLESTDRRVADLEGFEEGYDLRALTAVPQRAFREPSMLGRTRDLEPYRILRTALEFARVTRPLRTLMITSAVEGEGKTTIAIDLAHVIALSGRQVVLVELDLRRPSFARHMELSGDTGVTTAMVGPAPVGQLLQYPVADLPNFAVLPAGPLPPNPAELLEAPALDELLRKLLEDTGVTLVLDAPPLLPVADAQVLLNQRAIDVALVVARERLTTRDQVRRARSILFSRVVKPLGLVVTGHPSVGGYGYGYGYGEPYTPPAPSAPPAPAPELDETTVPPSS
jgi:tyrosine-protein kinase